MLRKAMEAKLNKLSSYERIRFQNIERNQKFLNQIGLKLETQEPPKKSVKRIRAEVDGVPIRRSMRVAELAAVDYVVRIYFNSISSLDNREIIFLGDDCS